MASNSTMIHKLQTAINLTGNKILYNTSQFYSDKQERPVTVYSVRRSVPGNNGRNKSILLFKSTSQIQILLFLRDMWFELNNKELPIDNENWNIIREKIKNGEVG